MAASSVEAQEKTNIEIAKLEQKREESLAKLSQAQESKEIDMEQKEKDRIAEYTQHIQKLQVDMEMQRRELTGQFNDMLKDVTHKLEMFKVQSQYNGDGTSINVSGTLENSGIKTELDKLMKRVSTKKKRTVKFLDDDTAEIVDEGEVE